MNLRDTALRAAAMRTLIDTAKQEYDLLRIDLGRMLTEVGADNTTAVLPDGRRVGKAYITVPEPQPHITDDTAFTDWISGYLPDSVSTRTVIAEWAVRQVLTTVTNVDGAAVLEADGQVVPGVEFRTAPPVVGFRFAPNAAEGKQMVMDAMRTGSVPLFTDETPAIEGAA